MAQCLLFGTFMATSADILGTSAKTKVPRRWASHYERLCAERDKLLERDCSSVESFQPKLDDMADAASQEAQRSLSLVAATATAGMIVEIIEAIRRIERGTYGICEITGEPIGPERLNSVPWARYSLKGQQQIEASGWARRPGLPALEGLAVPDPLQQETEEAAE
jgi:RNA polymerase-binding transcription factor DksA